MKDVMQRMVDYVEENLHCELSLTDIADKIGYSKFYLNRIFSIYTGISVMDYVRKRKLNSAMMDLQSDRRVIDIALDYGYNSERSFSRAFTKEFGHSPSHYRNNVLPFKCKLSIFDLSLNLTKDSLKTPLHPDLDLNVSNKGVDELMKYLSDVKYVTLPVMTVVSATLFGSEPEEEVINLMHDFAKEKGITAIREFGFDVPVESDKPVEEWRGYQIWLSISDEDASKLMDTSEVFNSVKGNGSNCLKELKYKGNKLSIKTIDSYRYATLRITDPFTEAFTRIPAGWKALIGWLDNNEFKVTDKPNTFKGYCLEEVTEKNGVICMDIFIPVEKL